MIKGKFKVFAGQREWLDEFLQYHRDENGKINKTRDDLLDATRYAYMMRRYSISFGDIGYNDDYETDKYKQTGRSDIGGY
jgi:hypothetical protein